MKVTFGLFSIETVKIDPVVLKRLNKIVASEEMINFILLNGIATLYSYLPYPWKIRNIPVFIWGV